MQELEVYDLSWVACGIVMIVLYIILLTHVLRGNRNRWLTGVCTMLLLSGFGALTLGYGDFLLETLLIVDERTVTIISIGAALY